MKEWLRDTTEAVSVTRTTLSLFFFFIVADSRPILGWREMRTESKQEMSRKHVKQTHMVKTMLQ